MLLALPGAGQIGALLRRLCQLANLCGSAQHAPTGRRAKLLQLQMMIDSRILPPGRRNLLDNHRENPRLLYSSYESSQQMGLLERSGWKLGGAFALALELQHCLCRQCHVENHSRFGRLEHSDQLDGRRPA